MYYRVQITIRHVPNAGPPYEGVAAENTSFTEFKLDSSSLSFLLRFLLFVVAIWVVVRIKAIHGSKVERDSFLLTIDLLRWQLSPNYVFRPHSRVEIAQKPITSNLGGCGKFEVIDGGPRLQDKK
jgi:hypothetical protein